MTVVVGVECPAVIVGDMARSQAFYCDLLGMRVVDVKGVDASWSAAEQERWHVYHEACVGLVGARIQAVLLEAPNGSRLELIEYRAPRIPGAPRRSPAEPGCAVIQFAVERSDVVVARLRAGGVTILGGPQPFTLNGFESRTTYVYDPDGTVVCLFEVLNSGDPVAGQETRA